MFKKPIIIIITILLSITTLAIAQREQDVDRAQREAEKQAEAKSNRKRSTKKNPKRTERPAA